MKIFSLAVSVCLLAQSCMNDNSTTEDEYWNFDDPSLTELVEAITPDFTIKEGPVCDTAKSFKVMGGVK